MECNLVWNHTRDFKIERARNASSIWNHKYEIRPKLHGPLLDPFWNCTLSDVWTRSVRTTHGKTVDHSQKVLELNFGRLRPNQARGRGKSNALLSRRQSLCILYIFKGTKFQGSFSVIMKKGQNCIDTNTARHFNLAKHSTTSHPHKKLALFLHQGKTESHKNLEQKFIFQTCLSHSLGNRIIFFHSIHLSTF